MQIPGARLGLQVTLKNWSGRGTLTANNRAWSCSGGGTATLTCTVRSQGRFKFVQRGLLRPEPVVVTFPAFLGVSFVIPVGR